jgi:hypothetical protein
MQPQPLPPWFEQAFRWLNYPVSRYWVLAGASLFLVALLAWLASACPPAARRWCQSSWLFGLAVIFSLAAFRWPTWFVQDEFNPDESQIIAGAITLRDHPVYWRDVDAMTQGPLNAYALTIASLAGLPLNFFGPRVFTLLLQAASLLAVHAALRRLTTESSARWGVFVPLAFWCLTSHHDFLHYSSELLSLLLLAFAGWQLAAALDGAAVGSRRPRAQLLAAGFALGLVPLAKLQGAPPAAALGLAGLAVLWRERPGRGWAGCGWLLAGGLGAPFLAITLVIVSGEGEDAWQAYILNNLWYVKTAAASAGPLARLLELVNAVPAFRAFWWGSLAAVAVMSVPAWRNPGPGTRGKLAIAWLLFGAGIMAVLGPGRPLPHYLEFLILPLAALLAIHLHAAGSSAATMPGAARSGVIWLGLLLLLAVLPQLVSRGRNLHIYAGQFLFHRYDHRPSQAAYYIRQRAQPGDTLAIWGWRPQIYVETGLAQGTREAQTERQLSLDPAVQAYYLQRYLHDMAERKPAWFVDAVGPASLGYHDRQRHGHEIYAELAQLISTRYDYLGEIENLRIYRRR